MTRARDHRIREYQTTPEAVNDTHLLVDYRFVPEDGSTLEESTFKTLLITAHGTIRPLHYEPGFDRGLVKRSVSEMGGYILIQELPNPEEPGLVTIAYPLHLCSETESLTGLWQLMSSGGEYRYTKEYWVERLTLPKEFVRRYRGPRFGVSGMRTQLGVADRPLVGLALEPRWGVPLKTLARVGMEALMGGADFICDDYLLSDPNGEMSLSTRVPVLAEVARKASERTGEKKSYLCTIVASPLRTAELAVVAIGEGVDGIVTNAFALGVGGLEDLVESLDDKDRVPIISTGMGVAVMARAPTHGHSRLTQVGMSEAIFSKLSRLAGADAVHTGTVGAECYGEMEWNRTLRAVKDPMGDIEPCFAVAAGDLGLHHLWENMSQLGPDLLIEATSALVNYPKGVAAGAEAFRTFVDELDPITMDDQAAEDVIAGIASRDGTIRTVLDDHHEE